MAQSSAAMGSSAIALGELARHGNKQDPVSTFSRRAVQCHSYPVIRVAGTSGKARVRLSGES
ncbi:hypothetical protein ACUN0C_16745 [Faunimonas sp. B44]|uniref:hypothetical protein n=1 Tax=Faunimonas sp. B44 TaxID=3461493 RepID=UPI0040449CD4